MKATTKDWVMFTTKDLVAAERLLEAEDLQHIVLFHCQQAIEKAFKAILEERGDPIPKIHSTFSLYERLPDEIKRNVVYSQDEAEQVDRIYLETRYPLDMGFLEHAFPTQEQAQQIVLLAQRIVNQCIQILKKEETVQEDSAPPHPPVDEQPIEQ